ncbi:hypothetical protein A1O3_02191 [Capronia epimyces CBS 606.96]|uniref:Transcription factor domain-containing protein n=1 Tax=Capronia epimyces CBS 606.96 TaxID=1182542 RepID=W9Y8E8_9EURO|nr:uncharacterized protein A1O3_02191 [Capronia epimyces CBS 606.96]EXJ89127.1 hypothetical protein A1O3_02191 [Capronia epimyces CBS 606.96]
MHFIVTTDAQKADPETQKFIRRQVMIGKNRGNSHRAKKRKATTTSGEVTRRVDHKRGPPGPSEARIGVEAYNSTLPRRVGSDLSFINLAIEMDSAAFGNMIRFLDVKIRAFYPLVLVTGICKKGAAYFDPLELDAAYLHVVMFAAAVFRNKVSGRQAFATNTNQDATATVHFLKGVQILRERLSLGDKSTHSSDSTIAAVSTLAMSALFMGEDETFKHHMSGLRKMVNLRGGIAAFKGNKLLSEIFRCDIGMAMQNGSQPIFFSNPRLDPVIPYPDQELLPMRKIVSVTHSRHDSQCFLFLDKMDPSLVEAWTVTQNSCSMINLSEETRTNLAPELLYDTMASVMYRLLHMNFDPGSVDEAVRLCLLGMSYHAFLQWQDLSLPCVYFPSIYKSCLLDPKLLDEAPSQLMLWLLMIGAVSAFTASDHPWLRDCLRKHINICQVKTWNEMRQVLKSFMWIGLLHDKPGKEIFEAVL